MTGKPDIRIEVDNERLWRDGQAVRAKKKVFALLTYFVENPQRLLTRQAILARVWPDTHVTDASVKNCVKNLRSLLGDNPENPIFIETVRGRGYRYLGGIAVHASGIRSDRQWESFSFFHDKPAVGVLPFENHSCDPDQDYFSEGLAEDIITLLSAWRSFPVVARNSSFAFKDRNVDVRQVAKELSARYIIEGSVRKSGDQVRVSAQLVDGSSGHNLWAQKFDGPLDDIFRIQDDITRRIVSSVEPEIEALESRRARAMRSSDLGAWDLYLRGRSLMHRHTPGDTAKARQLFQQAIKRDPTHSDAYAALSHTYQREILFEIAEDRNACGETAIELAQRAVALDRKSSLAHFALAGAFIWMNQHELSIAETRTAVELNPSNSFAVLALGNRLDIVGNSNEGIPLLERALDLHPRDPHSHVYYAQLARAYINAGSCDKALKCLHESILRKPDYPHTYHVLAICLGHLDMKEEARQAARRCEELHPGFIKKRTHWNIYVDEKANAYLTDGLRKAGIVR